jgi:DNA-binding GntR family transcriptional regulator
MNETHRLVAQDVADRIRGRILSGQLRPGERIKQEAIARECGTSRIPVRDALTRLNNEGLVSLSSYAGARVATLSAAELNEIYLLRERLEPTALAASVPRLSEETCQSLEECAMEMEHAADPESPSRWVELDRRFHLTSYGSAPLPEFLRLIDGLWNRTQQYRRAYTRLPESLERAHSEHKLLLAAIREGDSAQAEAISAMHIRRTRLALRDNFTSFHWTTT